MIQQRPRPRVLCVRPRINPKASAMTIATYDEWVETLALHSDILVINTDFDLKQTCDHFKPDMVVAEAIEWARPWPLTIANPRAHPDIPRVLFLNADAHEPMRPLTARIMDELGIDTVFVCCTAQKLHMPELRYKNCYYAPQFFDPTVFKDYGLPKSIPISIFGGHFLPNFYAWRAEIVREIEHIFPTLVYPHPGYDKDRVNPFAVSGEAYARLLSQSAFSAADTTRLNYAVRKHLEIPASGAILIAPKSDALTAYGFKDLENCLLGVGRELYEKIDIVSRQPQQYDRIRCAGMNLVHGRYTREAWTFLIDWLACWKSLKAGEMVQQIGLYGPFVAKATAPETPIVLRTMPDAQNETVAALSAARTAILTGVGLAQAEAKMVEATNLLHNMAEPHFMLGLCALLKGDPVKAVVSIARRAQAMTAIDMSLAVFDAVETAWIMLIARMVGNEDLERAMRQQAEGIDHLSLRRVLWLLDDAGNDAVPLAEIPPEIMERRSTDLLSIHWLGDEDFATWRTLVGRVATANASSIGSATTIRRRVEA